VIKNFKTSKRKENKGNPIRLSADLLAATLQARREWHNIFKVLRGKQTNLQPRILYPSRLSFRIEVEIKRFSKVFQTNRS